MCSAHARSIIAAFCSFGLFLFIGTVSGAQLTPQEKQRVVAALTNEINKAIQKYQSVPDIRDRVVRRMAECAFLLGTMGKSSPDPELKVTLADVSGVSLEVAVYLAKAMEMEHYKALVNAAGDSIALMSKRQDRKELSLLMRNCKSFNEVGEIDQAVQELTF